MTPVDIIALILTVIIFVKLIVLAIRKEAWMKIPKMLFAKPMISMIISFVLASVVLYYLLMEITIVQIFASMLLFAFLMLATMTAYPEILQSMVKIVMKEKNLIAKAWLPSLIWVLLTLWVLWALFY